jgi:hypothetical protein
MGFAPLGGQGENSLLEKGRSYHFSNQLIRQLVNQPIFAPLDSDVKRNKHILWTIKRY